MLNYKNTIETALLDDKIKYEKLFNTHEQLKASFQEVNLELTDLKK